MKKSEVQATLLAPVISIKNPYAGRIEVPAVEEIIRDDDRAKMQDCRRNGAAGGLLRVTGETFPRRHGERL